MDILNSKIISIIYIFFLFSIISYITNFNSIYWLSFSFLVVFFLLKDFKFNILFLIIDNCFFLKTLGNSWHKGLSLYFESSPII